MILELIDNIKKTYTNTFTLKGRSLEKFRLKSIENNKIIGRIKVNQSAFPDGFERLISQTNVDISQPSLLKIGILNQRREGGRRDHYNHYFGSVILSMIYMNTKGALDKELTYIMLGNGPFDEETLYLASKIGLNLIIIDVSEFKNNFIHSRAVHSHTMPAFDNYWELWRSIHIGNNFDIIKAGISEIFNIDFSHKEKKEGDKIIIIERKESDYHKKIGRESGSIRRHIPNLPKIFKLVKDENKSTEILALENINLGDKIRLFNEADIVICQHGAALFNTMFMRETSRVVEILPDDVLFPMRNAGQIMSHFNRLEYITVTQKSAHAAIDEQRVLNALRGR